MAWIPSQELDSQQLLKTQTEDCPAGNMARLPGLGVRALVTQEKQELSYKDQHPTNKLESLATVTLQLIPEPCFIKMKWGGEEGKDSR